MITKFILLLFVSVLVFAANAAELPHDTMQNLEQFSKKKLNEKTDFEELKKNIEVILILDDEDPSRTAVNMLSKSYSEHPALYDRAIKEIENNINRKKLYEIRMILQNFFKNGNG